MPANTTQGFPYPLPSEPVAEGAQAIRNLAEAIDSKLTAKAIVHVTRSTAYTTGPGGIGPASNWIPLDTVQFSAGPTMWVVGSPTRVTIPVAGIYAVRGQAAFASSATGYRETAVYKNRAIAIAYMQRNANVATNNAPDVDCFGVGSCVAGDYLELVLGQTAGGTLNAQLNATYQGLQVWRIG